MNEEDHTNNIIKMERQRTTRRGRKQQYNKGIVHWRIRTRRKFEDVNNKWDKKIS